MATILAHKMIRINASSNLAWTATIFLLYFLFDLCL